MLQVVVGPPVGSVLKVVDVPRDAAQWGFAAYLVAGSPGVTGQQVAAVVLHGGDVELVAAGPLDVTGQWAVAGPLDAAGQWDPVDPQVVG